MRDWVDYLPLLNTAAIIILGFAIRDMLNVKENVIELREKVAKLEQKFADWFKNGG